MAVFGVEGNCAICLRPLNETVGTRGSEELSQAVVG